MTSPKRLSQEAERSLERRLKARDERALGELYDQIAPWVLGLTFRILQDEDEAEEVVGDVFVQVWRHIDQHDARRGPLVPWILSIHDARRGPLVPWILSIARNRALDVLRRRRRWWRKTERIAQAQPVAEENGAPTPHEAGVPGWPVHREVHAALASLPEEQRRVVLLSYFEGLSHREIARRLNQPLGTVKTRMRMAHQRLSERLKHLKDWLQ